VALVVALCLVACSAAPLPDLGESATTTATLPPSLKEALTVMKDEEKFFKAGETKDGGLDEKKMNAAVSKFEDAGFKKAADYAERRVEEAALQQHVAHPGLMAKDSAKMIERGMNMAENAVGDDISVFETHMDKAAARAKAKGGGVQKKVGAHDLKVLSQGEKLVKSYDEEQAKMKNYAKTHPEDAKKLKAIMPSKLPRAGNEVLLQLGDAPAGTVGGVPKKTQASEQKGKSSDAKEPEKTSEKKSDKKSEDGMAAAKKEAGAIHDMVSATMKHVDATVDMQFAPLEEQLGFNLHQEAQLAKNQATVEEKQAINTQHDMVTQLHETTLANEITLAAKNADREAKIMKAAVEKAKQEHRTAEGDKNAVFVGPGNVKAEQDAQATGQMPVPTGVMPVPTTEELLQLGESKAPATFDLPSVPIGQLRPLVNKEAVQEMKQKDAIDDAVTKAMRFAEAKINTELSAVEPSDLQAQKGLQDPLDRTLSGLSKTAPETKHIQHEEALLESVKIPAVNLLQVEEAADLPPAAEGAPTPKSMPKSFDPYTEAVPVDFKLPATPIGDVQRNVKNDVVQALASDNIESQLAKAEVSRVEADNHELFAGLEPKGAGMHTYKTAQDIESKMDHLEHGVENARTAVAARVEEGTLPNGQPVH